MLCKKCGADDEPIKINRPDTPHQAELRCSSCSAFMGWLKKEKNESRRGKQQDTPESLGIDYCQLCRLKRSNIPDHETLNVHHLDGNPENENRENKIVLCTSCHRLIHHQITYRNHFIEKQYRIYEEFKKSLSKLAISPLDYENIIKNITDLYGL